MSKLMADLDNGDMPLDQRLTDLGLDPKEFKEYSSKYTHDQHNKGG
jgi:hypothetical protein